MKPAHIVLIEDNPADVMLVEMALNEAGISHELTRFEVGSDAADRLCSPELNGIPRPDVILLDLNTPRSDGLEVLRRLTAAPGLANVPIALLTSSRARSDKGYAANLGARYIEKPSQLEKFLSDVGRAVREMLPE